MNAIEVKNITKTYRLYDSPKDRLREIFSLKGNKYHHEFHALRDISFHVKKGQVFGVIGQNGSGKTTLLEIICGVLQPTCGTFHTNGRIAPLLGLGAGFNPQFTGRTNVYLNGALMGFSRDEMDQRFPHIEAFAEIGEFIDQPVKTYSSGMFVRLAFAAAVNINPEILVIDEALSVGDVFFQSKCFAKFKEFKEKGITIVFVTHSLNLISTYCDKAIMLSEGRIVSQGLPRRVINEYNRLKSSKSMTTSTSKNVSDDQHTCPHLSPSKIVEWQGLFELNPNEIRYGSKKAVILEAGIFTPDHKPVQILERNREYLIKVKVRHNDNMPAAMVAFSIKDIKGTMLCGTNTLVQNIQIGRLRKGEVILVTFGHTIKINPGKYLLCLEIGDYENKEFVIYDRRSDYMALQITAQQHRFGLFDPEAQIEWNRL